MLRGIPKRFANLVDGSIQAIIEIHKRIRRPQLAPQFLSRHNLPGILQQQRQHLERLILQTNLQPALAELAGRKVHLKGPEFHSASELG